MGCKGTRFTLLSKHLPSRVVNISAKLEPADERVVSLG
jgi:hypothetical protein